MIGLFDRLARPLLHALDPEDAHGLAIKMLKFVPLPPASRDDKRLATRVFGLNFPNPVGLAAGFDKTDIRIPWLGNKRLQFQFG